MRYRKTKGENVWHYCRNCSLWPASGYEESDAAPPAGEVCVECRSKDDRRECQTDPPSGGAVPT
jgi:hypothetical protein